MQGGLPCISVSRAGPETQAPVVPGCLGRAVPLLSGEELEGELGRGGAWKRGLSLAPHMPAGQKPSPLASLIDEGRVSRGPLTQPPIQLLATEPV